jgi:hypothetical protein
MAMRRIELLQWFGFAGAGLVWAAQLVLGFWTTQARCSPGGGGGLPHDPTQLALLAGGVVVALAAEWAAVTVYLETSPADADDPPPDGRRHFLASAAVVANLLFLVGIVLSGIAVTAGALCRQA